MKATTRNMITPAIKPTMPVASAYAIAGVTKTPPKNSDVRVNPEAAIPMIPKITA